MKMSTRTTLTLFGALLCVAFVSSPVKSLPAAPRPVALSAAAAAREPHPQINRAIVALETAKAHLRRAAHDFGGHRVEAIAAIDAALAQLRAALAFDKE
jgi:hypothetical protein